jgi:metallo-beta-lactamase class B
MRAFALIITVLTCCSLQTQAAAREDPWAQARKTWNEDQTPFKLFGDSFYVGTHGLSSVLITSKQGHILIDGDLPESVPLIRKHIEQLGFKLTDIKLIVNSHAHFDHAGGIAELQKVTGARVVASPWAKATLDSGHSDQQDPQFATIAPLTPLMRKAEVIRDGEQLSVGPLHITAHFTPGHTPGGTSWTWQSCEAERCLDLVYADSLNAVSSEGFRFSGDPRYPTAGQDLRASIQTVAALPCDILVSAHPEGSDLWDRLAKRTAGDPNGLIDATACTNYANAAKDRLDKRLDDERAH